MSGVPSEAYRIPRHIGIFGGSFDPPHISHVLAVHYALLVWPLDHVFVIPTYQHPFGKAMADFKHRVKMAKIAFEHLGDKVWVLPIEGEHEGLSYTIDTIRQLKAQYQESQFSLIVGSDILDELDEWKDHEALRREIEFLVIPRVGVKAESNGKVPEGVLPAVSSSTVRAALAQKQDVSKWVPRRVLQYISEYELYSS